MDSETTLGLGSFIFTAVAAWFIYVGVSADVTVATEAGEMANLQLMHIQATNIAIGIGSAVVAAILAVGAAIVGAIGRSSEISAS
jgi:hypothetical protein